MQRILLKINHQRPVVDHADLAEGHRRHRAVAHHKLGEIDIQHSVHKREAALVETHKVVAFSHLNITARHTEAEVQHILGAAGKSHRLLEKAALLELHRRLSVVEIVRQRPDARLAAPLIADHVAQLAAEAATETRIHFSHSDKYLKV